jgi:hypothetical protein
MLADLLAYVRCLPTFWHTLKLYFLGQRNGRTARRIFQRGGELDIC